MFQMGFEVRRFKVSYREVRGSGGALLRIPLIRFAGRWLERFGFKIGDHLRVEIRPGELVVRREGDEALRDESAKRL